MAEIGGVSYEMFLIHATMEAIVKKIMAYWGIWWNIYLLFILLLLLWLLLSLKPDAKGYNVLLL